MVWTFLLLGLSSSLMSWIRTLQLALIISSTMAMQSLVIMMFAWPGLGKSNIVCYLSQNFYTICSQPFNLNSTRHRLPPFAERCPQSETITVLYPDSDASTCTFFWSISSTANRFHCLMPCAVHRFMKGMIGSDVFTDSVKCWIKKNLHNKKVRFRRRAWFYLNFHHQESLKTSQSGLTIRLYWLLEQEQYSFT